MKKLFTKIKMKDEIIVYSRKEPRQVASDAIEMRLFRAQWWWYVSKNIERIYEEQEELEVEEVIDSLQPPFNF